MRISFVAGLMLVLAIAVPANAQSDKKTKDLSLAKIVKQVVLDPTTYVPPVFLYDSSMKDWDTSYDLFNFWAGRGNLFYEENPGFTVSGLPHDKPVSHERGKQLIRKEVLLALGGTVAHNAAERVIEGALLQRYPDNRKLIRVIGWAERIGVASYLSYYWSAGHYRQAELNRQMLASQR